MRALLMLVVLLGAPLAGCIGASTDADADALDPAAAPPAPTANAQSTQANGSADAPPAAPTTGSLVVLARMPDGTPLVGTQIEARNATRTTGSDGTTRFDALEPGSVEVVARKAGHRTARIAVEIVAGQETRTETVLAADGNDQHAHEHGVYAHRDLYTFEGHFDCSATYLIITGDCLVVVENVTRTAGAPDPISGMTTERHLIDFPLDVNWTTLIVEMEWDAQLETQATGGEMQLALEPAEAPADGHAAKYARVVGGSPLRIEMTPGVPHETATLDDMPNPNGGEVIRSRVFVTGVGHNAGGQGFLGVGAAAQHPFTLLVSIFYVEPAPAGYTAAQTH